MRYATFLTLLLGLCGAVGAEDAEFKLVRGERPPVDSALKTRVVSIEQDFYPNLDKSADALAEAKVEDYVRKYKVQDFYNAISRMEKALQGTDAKRSDVAWCRRWLTAYKQRVDEFAAKAKDLREAGDATAAAAVKDVSARLDELSSYFDPKSFKCDLDAPLTARRVREWITRLKTLDAIPPKGLAELDRLVKDHPEYAKDERIRSLQAWFKQRMPEAIKRGINRTIDSFETGSGTGPGVALQAIEQVRNILPPNEVPAWMLEDETEVNRMLKDVPLAIEGCQARLQVMKDYLAKADPEYEALLPQLLALYAKVEEGAKAAYENARLPEARSTSADLMAIAEKVLADPATESGARKRVVINADKQHESERRSSERIDGEWIYVKSWTEEYDWFQVAAAEKVGADWRIVFYQLRRYTKALKGDSNHEWYCAERIVGKKIREENIEK
ncbi:MAG: hypothetical protein K8T20_06620 [Planctomycetes bacterium]|nr:hypothetical protein [Planctomycetota bacterium]